MDSMSNQLEERKATNWCSELIKVTSYAVLIFLGCFIWYSIATHGHPHVPTFSVESTAVKAYNLTSDNRLIALINIGVRAGNPNSNNSGEYIVLQGVVVKVMKGKHHVLARETLPGDLMLAPGGDALLHVEAADIRHRKLKSKIAEEVRADAGAGEGRVNLRVSADAMLMGKAGVFGLCATCKDVVILFSRPTKRRRVQRVDCEANWCADWFRRW